MGVLGTLKRLVQSGDRPRESERAPRRPRMVDASHPVGTHGATHTNQIAHLGFLQNAVPGTGVVVSLEQSQRRIGNAPVTLVALEMNVDGWPPYRATYEATISEAALYSWQPGQAHAFRVSPDDPHSLMLG